MNKVLDFYDIYPKVVPAGKETMIHVRSLFDHVRFIDGAEYEVLYYPMERVSPYGEYQYQRPQLVVAQDGMLVFSQYFEAEQEHMFVINDLDEKMDALRFRIYSLGEDLFMKRPFKGDLHMHSSYSDGTESPAYMAASCRKIGLDFMAITDHHQYEPSLEAQSKFAELSTDLLICAGEEVHLPDNPMHIVNFGGQSSINEFVAQHEEDYYLQVKALESQIVGVEDQDARFQLASAKWGFERIRRAGGLAIFAHPFWEVWTGYYVSRTVIDYLMDHQPYDAIEVCTGYYAHEEYANNLQIARYYEEQRKGKVSAVLGVSDAHTASPERLFGWAYTVVFADALELDSLVSGIKGRCSVAVSSLPHQHQMVYGSWRLVKYTQFLIREVFPLHDRLCLPEGEQMLAHLAGDRRAAKQLSIMQGQTINLYNRLWAKVV